MESVKYYKLKTTFQKMIEFDLLFIISFKLELLMPLFKNKIVYLQIFGEIQLG